MKLCLECNKELIGRQRKFCCLKCKNAYNNPLFQRYDNQKAKGVEKKIKLVNTLGGKCTSCGYHKNLAGLCFHHINPESKSFPLTNRECANNSMKVLLEEVKKCILLCHNCHMELHYPKFNFSLLDKEI